MIALIIAITIINYYRSIDLKLSFDDPYKLVEQIFTPLSSFIPDFLKTKKRNLFFGLMNGSFQITIESLFFGQLINYIFTTINENKEFNWKLSNVYSTYSANLVSLIPYFSTVRAIQVYYPSTVSDKIILTILTPIAMLPFQYMLSLFANKINPNIPKPKCSMYHNLIAFFFSELVFNAFSFFKPLIKSFVVIVIPNGWSELVTRILCNILCYFSNHPTSVINLYMKNHPKTGFIQSIKEIYQLKGWRSFYYDVLQRCTRSISCAIMCSLGGTAFETLFLQKVE